MLFCIRSVSHRNSTVNTNDTRHDMTQSAFRIYTVNKMYIHPNENIISEWRREHCASKCTVVHMKRQTKSNVIRANELKKKVQSQELMPRTEFPIYHHLDSVIYSECRRVETKTFSTLILLN